MLLSIQTTSQKTMLSDRSCWIQFMLILVLSVKPLLSSSDNSEKACSNDNYRLDLDSSHEKRKELAYEFCKDVFSQLFTSDWSAAYQTMITEMPSPAPVNEAIFKKCDALKLLTPEWTIGLLKTRNPEARKRLMKKWERLLMADGPEKLKELIFLACTSTFNNEPNVVYIDWPDEIEEKSKKCPELTADPTKFDELQSQIKAVNKMTTKKEAEQSRKKISYAFCHALFSDKFSGEWSPEIYSIQTDEWSLGVDVSLVQGCPFVALLQPEVRMMRERREVDSKLRRQLGKCLFWPLNSGAKEDEAMKDAILELCNFAFTQPVGGGFPTWAIILICVFSALLLLTFAVIAICAWRRHRIKMKFRRDAEAVWAERMMNGEEPKSQMQLTKKTQDQSPPSAQEDTTCEDSARTIDMMPSEENLMPSEENLMQPSEENLQPQQQPKTERTMEEGSMMMTQTAMLPSAAEEPNKTMN